MGLYNHSQFEAYMIPYLVSITLSTLVMLSGVTMGMYCNYKIELERIPVVWQMIMVLCTVYAICFPAYFVGTGFLFLLTAETGSLGAAVIQTALAVFAWWAFFHCWIFHRFSQQKQTCG